MCALTNPAHGRLRSVRRSRPEGVRDAWPTMGLVRLYENARGPPVVLTLTSPGLVHGFFERAFPDGRPTCRV